MKPCIQFSIVFSCYLFASVVSAQSASLQDLIDQTPYGGVLDISDMQFTIDEQVTIKRPIILWAQAAVVTVVDYQPEQFPDMAAIFVDSAHVRVHRLSVIGPGRTRDELAGIRSVRHDSQFNDCHVDSFEYALYFVTGDNHVLRGCSGFQSFPEPWNGLDYGIVLHNTDWVRVLDCHIVGTRHALIVGENSSYVRIENCYLENTANVQCLAFKSTSERCVATGCTIRGGVNIGGRDQQILDNTIYARDEYLQPSTPIYCPKSTIASFDHDVIGNTIFANTIAGGSALYGVCYINLPDGEGTMRIHDNRFEITGGAPLISGNNYSIDFRANQIVRAQ